MERIEIIGNIGKDAEVKEFGGVTYTTFNVAVSHKATDKVTNEIVTATNWYSCYKRGDGIAKYLTKGTKVFVRGIFNVGEYISQNEKRYSLNINVSEIEFCSSKSDNEVTQTSTPQQAEKKTTQLETDDLPF